MGSTASLDRSPRKNWVENSGNLPPYVREIARSIEREQAVPLSRAISLAIGAVKRWARGGGNVNSDTRAKAAKAVAQWTALRAKNAARQVATSHMAHADTVELADDGSVLTRRATGDGLLVLSQVTDTGTVVELARYVRTPAGAKRYGRPIGALIEPGAGRARGGKTSGGGNGSGRAAAAGAGGRVTSSRGGGTSSGRAPSREERRAEAGRKLNRWAEQGREQALRREQKKIDRWKGQQDGALRTRQKQVARTWLTNQANGVPATDKRQRDLRAEQNAIGAELKRRGQAGSGGEITSTTSGDRLARMGTMEQRAALRGMSDAELRTAKAEMQGRVTAGKPNPTLDAINAERARRAGSTTPAAAPAAPSTPAAPAAPSAASGDRSLADRMRNLDDAQLKAMDDALDKKGGAPSERHAAIKAERARRTGSGKPAPSPAPAAKEQGGLADLGRPGVGPEQREQILRGLSDNDLARASAAMDAAVEQTKDQPDVRSVLVGRRGEVEREQMRRKTAATAGKRAETGGRPERAESAAARPAPPAPSTTPARPKPDGPAKPAEQRPTAKATATAPAPARPATSPTLKPGERVNPAVVAPRRGGTPQGRPMETGTRRMGGADRAPEPAGAFPTAPQGVSRKVTDLTGMSDKQLIAERADAAQVLRWHVRNGTPRTSTDYADARSRQRALEVENNLREKRDRDAGVTPDMRRRDTAAETSAPQPTAPWGDGPAMRTGDTGYEQAFRSASDRQKAAESDLRYRQERVRNESFKAGDRLVVEGFRTPAAVVEITQDGERFTKTGNELKVRDVATGREMFVLRDNVKAREVNGETGMQTVTRLRAERIAALGGATGGEQRGQNRAPGLVSDADAARAREALSPDRAGERMKIVRDAQASTPAAGRAVDTGALSRRKRADRVDALAGMSDEQRAAARQDNESALSKLNPNRAGDQAEVKRRRALRDDFLTASQRARTSRDKPELTPRAVLDQVIDGGNLDTRELADTFGVDQPKILRTLRDLEAKGVIERGDAGTDGSRGGGGVSGGRSSVSSLVWSPAGGQDVADPAALRAKLDAPSADQVKPSTSPRQQRAKLARDRLAALENTKATALRAARIKSVDDDDLSAMLEVMNGRKTPHPMRGAVVGEMQRRGMPLPAARPATPSPTQAADGLGDNPMAARARATGKGRQSPVRDMLDTPDHAERAEKMRNLSRSSRLKARRAMDAEQIDATIQALREVKDPPNVIRQGPMGIVTELQDELRNRDDYDRDTGLSKQGAARRARPAAPATRTERDTPGTAANVQARQDAQGRANQRAQRGLFPEDRPIPNDPNSLFGGDTAAGDTATRREAGRLAQVTSQRENEAWRGYEESRPAADRTHSEDAIDIQAAGTAQRVMRSGDLTGARQALAGALRRPEPDRQSSANDAVTATQLVLRGDDPAQLVDVSGANALPAALVAQAAAIRGRIATSGQDGKSGRLGRFYEQVGMGDVADKLDAEAARRVGVDPQVLASRDANALQQELIRETDAAKRAVLRARIASLRMGTTEASHTSTRGVITMSEPFGGKRAVPFGKKKAADAAGSGKPGATHADLTDEQLAAAIAKAKTTAKGASGKAAQSAAQTLVKLKAEQSSRGKKSGGKKSTPPWVKTSNAGGAALDLSNEVPARAVPSDRAGKAAAALARMGL
ncbi:hypothetical protein [Microcystis phage Mwe-JY05]